MAPPIEVVVRSPRTEKLLTDQTLRLQTKVDSLEAQLAKKDAELRRLNTRNAATNSGQGGSTSDHWELACNHASQAMSLCCVGPPKPPTPPTSPQRRPGSPVRPSMHGRKGVLPDWASKTEKHMAKSNAAIEVPKQSLANSPLEEHEYVLEDEWDFAPTYGIINPKAKWKESWDICIMLLIIYSSCVVPFRICFSAEAVGWVWDFEVAASIIFIIDVGFTFNLAYAVEDKLVISRARICSRYLSGWFWIDMPSSLPVELMSVFLENANTHLSLLRFLRMFRLLRLLRLLKLDVYVAVLEDRFEVNLVALRILGMVSRLCFMVHILGCFWFYVAAIAYENGEEVTWVTSYDDGSALEGPVSRQYVFSVYWALTTLTTIGYGDITPTNMAERYYCLFAMLVGAMMFGYMMSTIGSMVQQMDQEANLKEQRMDAVKEWMQSRNMPRKLFVRVRKYYEHYYAKKSAFDEDAIVKGLTPALQQEVTTILLRDSLGHFPLFALLGTEFQHTVYPKLRPLTYANTDVVYARGDISHEIFFLRKGTVDVLASGLETKTLYRLHPGQYFGEEVLTHQRRGCSVVSNGWTEIWSLAGEVLDETTERFPELVAKLDEFVVGELERKERLYALSYRILIGVATDPERRAALIVQKFWTAHAAARARRDSQYAATSTAAARLRERTTTAGITTSRKYRDPAVAEAISLQRSNSQRTMSSSNLTESSTVPKGLQDTLKDIQLQLSNLKRAVTSQSAVLTKLEGQNDSMYKAVSPGKKPIALQTYDV